MSEPQKNRQVTNMDQKQNEDKILRMKELHRQLLAASELIIRRAARS